MKKNKMLILISIALILVFCGIGIIGYAQSQNWLGRQMPDTISKQQEVETTKTITSITTKAALNSQKDTVINAQEVTEILNYSHTDSFDAKKPIDVYLDSKNGQYRYNREGRLLNYISTDHNLLNPPTRSISKSQASEIALARLKAAYGSLMDTMVLSSCEILESGSFPGQYEVNFEKQGGKNGFIFICGITVHVSLEGDILGFSASSSPEKEALDLAAFEDLSEDTLRSWTKKQMAKSAAKPFSQCKEDELNFSYDVLIEDNTTFVRILVACDRNEHGHPNQTYLYQVQ